MLLAQGPRKDEAKLYSKTASDLKKTIQAVDDALKALSSAEGKTEPGMLLAQGHVKKMLALISLKSVTENQLNELKTFADQPKERPKQLAKGDLDAHVDKYDFKSESVIELLKQLKLKFQDDKMAATKAETNALNAYDLAKEARDNAIK